MADKFGHTPNQARTMALLLAQLLVGKSGSKLQFEPKLLRTGLEVWFKVLKICWTDFRSSSKFNRSYFDSNLFESQNFQCWNSLETQPNFGIANSDWPRLISLIITHTLGSFFIHLKPNSGLPNCLTASNIIYTIAFSGMSVTNKANSLGGGTRFS